MFFFLTGGNLFRGLYVLFNESHFLKQLIHFSVMKTIINILLFGVFILFPHAGNAQMISVSGVVKNYVTDRAIENASIYEAFSGIGTISNSDGYYHLLLKPGKQHLNITSPGFEKYSQEFRLTGDTIISLQLIPVNFGEKEIVADRDSEKLTDGQTAVKIQSEKKKF